MLALPPPQFYILRKLIEAEWGRKGFSHKRTYVASLSAQTIVYKGQLMPSQVTWHCCVGSLPEQAGLLRGEPASPCSCSARASAAAGQRLLQSVYTLHLPPMAAMPGGATWGVQKPLRRLPHDAWMGRGQDKAQDW